MKVERCKREGMDVYVLEGCIDARWVELVLGHRFGVYGDDVFRCASEELVMYGKSDR
jgi:hypothetical protein